MISWTSLAIDSKFIEVLEIPFSKVVFYFKIFVSQVKKKQLASVDPVELSQLKIT